MRNATHHTAGATGSDPAGIAVRLRLLTGIVCAALAACNASQSQPKDDAGAGVAAVIRRAGTVSVPERSPLRRSMVISAAQSQMVERPVLLPGVVEADPARLVKAVPPLSGRIVELPKQLGQAVGAGDPLFSLDSSDMALAHSDAAKAQAALVLAERNLERQRDLAQDEIGVRRDLEQAESDYRQATTEVQRTRVRLSQLGSAPAAANVRRYTFRSPIAGRVVELNGARGGFWNDTNAPIMTVADLSVVWVVASAHEKELASVFVGQPASITLDAYEGETISGNVRYVGAMLDADTRTVKLRIPLDNASGRLRPGMFAKVQVRGPAHPAIVVPAAALVQSGFNTRVFVETAAWTFQPRIVRTGAALGDAVEVVDGLEPGERIVVKDGVLLND
jgi:cobalt-zinc-cadmium efflux system membrane fusion protein